MSIDLVIHYRHRGWRWPFRAGDCIEVWRASEKVAELPGELVHHLLVYHLRGVALSEAVRDCLATADAPRLRGVNGRALRRVPR